LSYVTSSLNRPPGGAAALPTFFDFNKIRKTFKEFCRGRTGQTQSVSAKGDTTQNLCQAKPL
jgi:hypothetical protein